MSGAAMVKPSTMTVLPGGLVTILTVAAGEKLATTLFAVSMMSEAGFSVVLRPPLQDVKT